MRRPYGNILCDTGFVGAGFKSVPTQHPGAQRNRESSRVRAPKMQPKEQNYPRHVGTSRISCRLHFAHAKSLGPQVDRNA